MSVQNFKLDKQADPLLTEGERPVFSESGGMSLDICHVSVHIMFSNIQLLRDYVWDLQYSARVRSVQASLRRLSQLEVHRIPKPYRSLSHGG